MNFLASFIVAVVVATTSLFASATSAEARCYQQCYRSQGYIHCQHYCPRPTCPAGHYLASNGRCYPRTLTCPSGYYLAVDNRCYPHASTYTYSPPFDTNQRSPTPFVIKGIQNNIDLDTILIIAVGILFFIIVLLDDDQSKVIERIEQATAHEWQQAQYAQEQAAQARAAAAQLEHHMQQERQRARALGYQQG